MADVQDGAPFDAVFEHVKSSGKWSRVFTHKKEQHKGWDTESRCIAEEWTMLCDGYVVEVSMTGFTRSLNGETTIASRGRAWIERHIYAYKWPGQKEPGWLELPDKADIEKAKLQKLCHASQAFWIDLPIAEDTNLSEKVANAHSWKLWAGDIHTVLQLLKMVAV